MKLFLTKKFEIYYNVTFLSQTSFGLRSTFVLGIDRYLVYTD